MGQQSVANTQARNESSNLAESRKPKDVAEAGTKTERVIQEQKAQGWEP